MLKHIGLTKRMHNKTVRINLISVIAMVLATVFIACFMLGCAEETPVSPARPVVKYVAEIDEKIERINAVSRDNKITDSFFYITDLHWEDNDKNSPWIVQYIQSKTNVDTIVFGGDYISRRYTDKQVALNLMQKCIDSFMAQEYCALIGNHEMNIVDEENDDVTLVTAEEINYVLNNGRFDKSYFCIEDKASKVCKVCLNTNIFDKDGEQYNWLKDTLTSLGSDMTAFIFMHIYNDYKPAGVPLTISKTGVLLNALLSNISEDMTCTIGGIFSGHTHRDFMGKTDLGYTVLGTTCDGIGAYNSCDDAYERAKDEYSAQAFDVVQVDTTNRKVFLTRIGAGYDRQYTY